MEIALPSGSISNSKDFETRIFRLVQTLLLVLLAGLTAWSVYQIFFARSDLERLALEAEHLGRRFSQVTDDSKENKKNFHPQDPIWTVLKTAQPFDNYQKEMGPRDLFQSLSERKKINETKPVVNLAEFTQNFKLVGIILDHAPQAVIRDLQTNQTLFLQRGEQMNGAVIQDIQEGKVIFTTQGERGELIQ